ncbi:MAG: DUF3299 domain-containing protein [Gammaproteobacteria bacterium]|nr:DUF3299 domain-containing protein [Gammaproteobacteria bacterium]
MRTKRLLLNFLLLSITMLPLWASDNLPSDELNNKLKADESTPQADLRLESASLPIAEFKTVEWTDLIPEEDLDALLNPPSYLDDIEDGSFEDFSFEDQISAQIQNSLAAANDDSYQLALSSTRVIEAMDGQAIRIAGFIVPLEFDDEQTITQFFLVPFFGACIHVPPPPPNQIIFVNYPQGLKQDSLYDPFWISGVLNTSLVENDMAMAAYSMQMQSYEVYTD